MIFVLLLIAKREYIFVVRVLLSSCVFLHSSSTMPDRFLEADIAALEKLIAVDSDEEIPDLYVDVRVQKEDELREARTTLRGIYFHLGNFSEVECVERTSTAPYQM